MVDEVVLRAFDNAVRDAGNKRNQLQFEVNELRSRLAEAAGNLQRAQNQEQASRERHRLKSEEHRKVLAFYNGEADKTGLGAILTQIDGLVDQTNAILLEVRKAEEIRMGSHRDHEQAKIDLAVGESNLKNAQKEWLEVSERSRKAREEQ